VTAPSAQVRQEFESLLEQDQSRTGQVYRLTRRGMTPPQIAKELGVSTSGFVSNARTIARGLTEGHVPSGPTAAQQVLSFVQRVATDRSLSDEAQQYLADQAAALERAAGEQPTTRSPDTARTRSRSAEGSLRSRVEAEVRRRTRELVTRINDETGLEAYDYRVVVSSERPLDAVVRLIRWRGDEGTFGELMQRGRRDLTLDNAVVQWSQDLPLTTDLVEEAAARIEWLS